MANYTSSTSDKSKKTAKILCLCGGIGLHLFYVGRIKPGIARLVIGVLCWVCIIGGIAEIGASAVIGGLLILIIINTPDFVKLCLGSFKDNVGAPLRN